MIYGSSGSGSPLPRRNRRSLRLQGYDYSQPGLYFITICTHKRAFLFGEIKAGVMLLNDAGRMAEKCWLEIPEHFPNAVLHEYIVMPNHVHGIIELTDHTNAIPDVVVGMKDFSSLPMDKTPFRSPSRTIGSVIRGYKIGVTKWFREAMPHDFPVGYPVWQRNYYEHIIRNQKSYENISEYIIENPTKWDTDRFYRSF